MAKARCEPRQRDSRATIWYGLYLLFILRYFSAYRRMARIVQSSFHAASPYVNILSNHGALTKTRTRTLYCNSTILLTKLQNSFRFPEFLHSWPFPVPRLHFTLSSHNSLVTSQQQFHHLSSSFMTLSLLKSTSQVSCRMSFNLSLSVFSWLHHGDRFRGRT